MNILAIGAHPDDVETGVGATIAMRPHDVTILTLTECDCAPEWRRSMKVLNPHRSILSGYFKRTLNQFDVQEGLRETLEEVRDDIHPDLIFTHHPTSLHQDHHAVYEETLRVFKRHTLIGYSVAGWYTPNLYIPVSLEAVRTKINALKCYKSQQTHQSGHTRYSMLPTVIRGILEANGMHVNVPYAEAFELLRGIWHP